MKIRITLLLSLLYLAVHSPVTGQGLIIRMHNGSESQMLISSVQKLSFAVDQLVLTPKTGTPETFGLADIQKLYFGVVTAVPEPLTDNGHLTVFPNPSEKAITIRNLTGNYCPVKIFRPGHNTVLLLFISTIFVVIDLDLD